MTPKKRFMIKPEHSNNRLYPTRRFSTNSGLEREAQIVANNSGKPVKICEGYGDDVKMLSVVQPLSRIQMIQIEVLELERRLASARRLLADALEDETQALKSRIASLEKVSHRDPDDGYAA